MKRFILLLFALCGGLAGAQTIDLRISVHVILHPTDGTRPAGISNEVFYLAEANANAVMATYYRGYRFRVAEITNIGGPMNGGYNGPSQWFGRSLSKLDSDWDLFQSQAATDSLYRLRTNQINVYVSQEYSKNSGGASCIPPKNMNTAIEIFPDTGSFWMLHEVGGHFFGLYHIFAGDNTTNCTPGDNDEISDTLADCRCWTNLDQVAQYHFGKNYDSLTNALQKTQVEDVFFNVMSYHDSANKNQTVTRLTELQLDREADHASGDRNEFASGKTFFVSTSGTILGTGGSLAPLRYLSQSLTLASAVGGDIILLRPGSYNEQITIDTPVTLRAQRTGWATIGK